MPEPQHERHDTPPHVTKTRIAPIRGPLPIKEVRLSFPLIEEVQDPPDPDKPT
jgi:hypothetical protein